MSETRCQMQPTGLFAGVHIMAELAGVQAELLDDERRLRHVLRSALVHAEATVLKVVSNRFVPQGVTILALLAESHASLHTYPEVGAAFVDVFTCGDRAKPALAVQYLADALEVTSMSSTMIHRGVAGDAVRLEVTA